jgi:hypothetical protein
MLTKVTINEKQDNAARAYGVSHRGDRGEVGH